MPIYAILELRTERELGLGTYVGEERALTRAIQFVGLEDAPLKVGVFNASSGELLWKLERFDSLGQTGVDNYAVVVKKPYPY